MLDAVIYATDKMAQGMVTSLITADTSKAFDSVEHGRLLEKLGWYGIRLVHFLLFVKERLKPYIFPLFGSLKSNGEVLAKLVNI